MVTALHSLIILMFIAIVLVSLAQKLRIPYPLALVIGGGVISFVPGLPSISFNPDMVLVSVLPPILFYAAYSLPLREFKKNIKTILSLAFWLVLVTTIIIGFAIKWLLPEVPYALAFAFGAIVSPPDAVATITTLRRFAISPKTLATLEGESLINDASSLVLNKIAVIALLSGTFSAMEASIDFCQMAIGGVIIGVTSSYLFNGISRRFHDSALSVVYTFTLPYLTYMIAEHLHVSGVLAVVANGIVGARLLSLQFSSQTRVLGWASWDIFIILLNCLVFILIGSQLHVITHEMTLSEMLLYFSYAALLTCIVIAVRLIWILTSKVIMRIIKGPLESEQWQSALVMGWSGMRGIVSLIAALALPYYYKDGSLIPGRDIVIYLTYVVITLSLIVPYLILPLIFRWFKTNHHVSHCTLKVARHRLQQIAQETLETLHETQELILEDKNFLSNYFHARHRLLDVATAHHHTPHIVELTRKKVVQAQRRLLFSLWDNQEIDDETLRLLERELDVEEFHGIRAKLN